MRTFTEILRLRATVIFTKKKKKKKKAGLTNLTINVSRSIRVCCSCYGNGTRRCRC